MISRVRFTVKTKLSGLKPDKTNHKDFQSKKGYQCNAKKMLSSRGEARTLNLEIIPLTD